MTDARDLQAFIDRWRSEDVRRFSLPAIIRDATAAGLMLEDSTVKQLIALHYRGSTGEFIRPPVIAQFIIDYLKPNPPQAILDSWAGLGQSLASLVRRFRPRTALAVERVREVAEAARLLHPDLGIDWRNDDPRMLLPKLCQQFDAIIASPPWDTSPAILDVSSGDGILTVTDELGRILILLSAVLLTPEGTGFFVTSSNFLWNRRQNGVVAQFERFGLYVHAALTLPTGTFAPTTNLGGLVVLIRRERPAELFVGELTSDPSRRLVLIANLRGRRAGSEPQLGALVDPAEFRSLERLVAESEIKRLARGMGGNARRLGDFATVSRIYPNRSDSWANAAVAVYLPNIGRTSTLTSLTSVSELQLKPQNYMQIVADPEVANPLFLAQFFNSTLGQRIREQLFSGAYIQHITLAALRAAPVYLPPLPMQLAAVETNKAITDLSSRLEELRRELWSAPACASNVRTKVDSLNREDSLVSWMESLPFALASILWAYHAQSNVRDRVEHLFLFFEGLSQFMSVLLLSGFAAFSHFDTEGVAGDVSNSTFARASFGSWNVLLRKVSKSVRQTLEHKEQRPICLAAFGYPDPQFMDMLISPSLHAILEDVAKHRNNWKGHGGAVSERESLSRLALLEEKLAETRNLISSTYVRVRVLRPDKSRYRQGIFHYEAKALMGTRTPFPFVEVETLSPMESDRLYVLHVDQQNPVGLLPLVRLLESPATHQNAWYFYNRLQGEEVRWVSYHFDVEAEIVRPDPDAQAAVALLDVIDRLKARGPWT